MVYVSFLMSRLRSAAIATSAVNTRRRLHSYQRQSIRKYCSEKPKASDFSSLIWLLKPRYIILGGIAGIGAVLKMVSKSILRLAASSNCGTVTTSSSSCMTGLQSLSNHSYYDVLFGLLALLLTLRLPFVNATSPIR